MAAKDFKLSKHDRYVEELCTKIKDKYDSVSKHVAVKAKKRMLAEVDVLAKKGNDVDIYEVKCSPRVVKAKRQLKKIKNPNRSKLRGIYDDSWIFYPKLGMIIAPEGRGIDTAQE